MKVNVLKVSDIKQLIREEVAKQKRVSFSTGKQVDNLVVTMFADIVQINPKSTSESDLIGAIGEIINDILDKIDNQLTIHGYNNNDISNFKSKVLRNIK
jgi:hypothetical protein